MVTLDWTWRAVSDIPDEVLLVVTRTEYDAQAWAVYTELRESGFSRFLSDPNILGGALWTYEDERVSWASLAWRNYDALRDTVYQQLEWLSKATAQMKSGRQKRHNAYRRINSDALPLSYSVCEGIVQKVMQASPLGADAFPELSKALGIDGGTSYDAKPV